MDSNCSRCGAAATADDKVCGPCGGPVAASLMAAKEVLVSPRYIDRPPRYHNFRTIAGLCGAFVAVMGAGLVYVLGAGDNAREVVEDFAKAYGVGDCEKAADAFHYEGAYDRASEVAICTRAGDSSKLLEFEVTGVDESPKGLAVPDGASDVVYVRYRSEFLVNGDSETIDDRFVVAKFDGAWRIVFDVV